MTQHNKQPQFPGSNPRVTAISIALFLVVALLVGRQFMTMSNAGAGAQPTDTLITSEFVQAVEQDRVVSVVYDARSYTEIGRAHV